MPTREDFREDILHDIGSRFYSESDQRALRDEFYAMALAWFRARDQRLRDSVSRRDSHNDDLA